MKLIMLLKLQLLYFGLYYSATAWLFAILINLYGAVLNLVAFTGRYKT